MVFSCPAPCVPFYPVGAGSLRAKRRRLCQELGRDIIQPQAGSRGSGLGLVDVNLREMVWGIACLSLEVCISPSVLFSDHFLFLVPFSPAPFKPPGSI